MKKALLYSRLEDDLVSCHLGALALVVKLNYWFATSTIGLLAAPLEQHDE